LGVIPNNLAEPQYLASQRSSMTGL